MKLKGNSYVFFIALVSAMGGFLFGYDWVVVGGAKPFYEPFFNISGSLAMQGWAMSSALIGCLVGALSSGIFSDKYGRKRTLISAAFVFIIAALGTGIATTFTVFVIFRMIGGFAIGVASNLSPMYIAEVSPANLRGKLVSLNQMTIVLGILSAQVVNWLIAEPVEQGASVGAIKESWNGLMGWRWMFWAGGVPAIFFFIFSFIIPESPRWLAVKDRKEDSIRIMSRIVGSEQAEAEYAVMQSAIDTNRAENNTGSFKKILHPSMRLVLTIGIILAVFQQWCGINVIFNYAHEIFSAAGYGVSDILMNIVVTGITNVVFTILAIFLVDRIGRRVLLMIGAGGLALIYILMGGAYYFNVTGVPLLIIVVAAIACYAMSLGPVMWVVVSEIFPNAVRGVAMSFATFSLWAACFILTYTFPLLNGVLGAAGTFWIYGAICIFGLMFILKFVPETKNKSLEEIEKELIK